jgi:hypothetical protein
MSMWDITDLGFLGVNDPLRAVATTNEKYIPLVARLETMPYMLAHWIEGRRVREEIVHALRQAPIDEGFFNVCPVQDETGLERLMHLYSYMGSAYVYARYENPATHIPPEIAVPLVRIAQKLDRRPILSYARSACGGTSPSRPSPRSRRKRRSSTPSG